MPQKIGSAGLQESKIAVGQRGTTKKMWFFTAKSSSVQDENPIPADSPVARGPLLARVRATGYVIFTAVVLTIATVFAISYQRREADRQRVLEIRLRTFEVVLHATNAAEWKMIAQRPPDLDSIRELRQLRARAGVLVKELAREPDMATVTRLFGDWDDALGFEVRALEQGEEARAKQIDQQQVDPAFDRLNEAIQQLSAETGGRSAAEGRRADLYSIGLLVGAVIISVFLFGRARVHDELRRVHELVRDRERSYRQLFEESVDAVFVVDEHQRIADTNRAATVLTGEPTSSLVGRLFFGQLFHIEHDGTIPAPAKSLFDGAECQVSLLRINGTRANCLLSSSVRRDHDGTGIGHQVFVRDITERMRANEAMALLSERTAAILASAGEGVVGLDLDGNHTFVSSSAAAMFGHRTEELIGTAGHSTWHHTRSNGRPYPLEECAIHAADQSGSTIRRSDEIFWRKDGTSFPVEFISTPLRERGKLTGTVVVFSDITERRRAESERERLVHELQDALAEVKTLSGILPICAWCKQVRDDEGYWHQVEVYVRDHSEAEFSHGICPSCAARVDPGG